MKAIVSQPETWKRTIEFEVGADEVGAAIDAKLLEYKKKANLPGFRQGKVPIAVIKQRFGEAAKGEVIEKIIKDSYKTACDEHKIEPVSGASVTDVKECEGGEPLRFTIDTEVDPPIEIKGYDKLKIKVKTKKFKDSDVEERYKHFLERFATFSDVSRKSKKGDFLRIKYQKVIIDGEERADLKDHSPPHPIELGAEGVFKEFDRELTGVKAGDVADIDLTFPKDYADANVAGKNATFTVEVVSVQEQILPEVNEEFLKKLGDIKSEEALKAELKKGMEEEEEARAKREAHNEAIETLIKENPFEVPPSKIEQFTYMMMEDFAKQNGGHLPMPQEELAQQYKPAAEAALKRIRIVDYVADKEKIKATQEEVDKEIERMAQHYGHDFEELKELLRKNGTTNRIRLDIREKKTLDFLIGAAD